MDSESKWSAFISKGLVQVCLILSLGLVLLLPGTATSPLLDRDEPRFAQATVEMMERNEWVVPYFNGNYRFDKPVLTYWLMRFSYRLFGKSEFASRVHSIVSTILVGLLLFWVGRRWFSSKIGFAAAVGLLSSLQFIVNGRSCIADMPMVLAVAVSQVCLYELLRRPDPRAAPAWIGVLYVSLGLGFLAKGPIAILVPAVSAALFRFVFWRQPLPWRNLKLPTGIPLVFAIVASWGVPALIETKGLFWKVGMNEHVVRRGLEAFNGRLHSPLYYLGTFFFSLFPWVAFAGQGWYVLRRRWQSENAFLAAWFAAPYLIFSFYATQLPHYVMPGFAAFFLILAQSFEMPDLRQRWITWWFRVVTAIPLVAVTAMLCWLLFVRFPGPLEGLRFCLWGAVFILIGLVSIAVLVRYRGWKWMWISVLIVGVGLQSLGTGLRRTSPAVQMASLFKAAPPRAQFLAYRFTEGTLVFYADKHWEMTDNLKKVKRFLAGPGPRLVVFLESQKKLDRYLKWQWKQWMGRPVPFKFEDRKAEIDNLDTSGYASEVIQGLDLGPFTWATIRVFYRFGS